MISTILIYSLCIILMPFSGLFNLIFGSQRNLYYYLSTHLFNIIFYFIIFYFFRKKMTKKIKIICWTLFTIVTLSNLAVFLILFLSFAFGRDNR